jgi:stearoyl-CoA desaturase (delta-9 desaturase)
VSAIEKILTPAVRFIDSDYFPEGVEKTRELPERFEFKRAVPVLILHLGCLGVIWVGWSWAAVATAVFLYFTRMFAITGLYHRYFCHRAFHTSRAMQFVFALIGLTAVQRGPRVRRCGRGRVTCVCRLARGLARAPLR